MNFDDRDAIDQLAAMTDDELDALPFGVIAFDAKFRVVAYNATESKAAGLSKERVMGRELFNDVAPCMNNFMVAQRFLDETTLDATVDYVLTFRMRPTRVVLRLLRRTSEPRRFLLIRWS